MMCGRALFCWESVCLARISKGATRVHLSLRTSADCGSRSAGPGVVVSAIVRLFADIIPLEFVSGSDNRGALAPRNLSQTYNRTCATVIALFACLLYHGSLVACLSSISLVSRRSFRLSRAVSRNSWRRSKRSTPSFLRRCLPASTTARAFSATRCCSAGGAHTAVIYGSLPPYARDIMRSCGDWAT